MDQDTQQQYREKRVGIARRAVAKGRDANIPFLSPILRHYQDISGRTYEGDKLSLKERGAGFVKATGEAAEMYTALGGGGAAAAEGKAAGAAESQGAKNLITKEGVNLSGKSAPALEKASGFFSSKGATRTSGALQKGATFLKNNPKLAEQGEKYAEKKINSKIADIKNYKEPSRNTPQSRSQAPQDRSGVVGGAPRIEPLRTRGLNQTVAPEEEEYLDDLSYLRNNATKIKNEITRNYNSEITAENKEIRDQVQHAEKMKQPSGFWFIVIAIYAIILDIIDIIPTVLAIITGVSEGSSAPVTIPAWLLATAIELVLDVPLYIYAHKSSKQMKKSKKVIQLAESRINGALRKVQMLESRIRSITKGLKRTRSLNRWSKRSAIGKKARSFLAGTLKITKKARGTARMLLAFVADLIPLLELVPWRTIAIIQQYRGRKKIYQGALEYEAQYEEVKSQEISALEDFTEAQEEQVDEEEERAEQEAVKASR